MISLLFWIPYYIVDTLRDWNIIQEGIAKGKLEGIAKQYNRNWHVLGRYVGLVVHSAVSIAFLPDWKLAVSVGLWGIGIRQLLHDGIINIGFGRPFLYVTDKSTSPWDQWLTKKPKYVKVVIKVGPIVAAIIWEVVLLCQWLNN